MAAAVLELFSGTSMTGRPGHCTMEMNGKGTESYLARTPRVPFSVYFIGLEAKGLLDFQRRRGIASIVRCGTFAVHIRCRFLESISHKSALISWPHLLCFVIVSFPVLQRSVERINQQWLQSDEKGALGQVPEQLAEVY